MSLESKGDAPVPNPDYDGLSPDEARLVRDAAYFAGILVARAERGVVQAVKESFAATRALQAAPERIRHLFTGLPKLPELREGEVLETVALDQLRRAVAVLKAKLPGYVDEYRATVLQSARDVAAAAGDTSADESLVIAQVEAALA